MAPTQEQIEEARKKIVCDACRKNEAPILEDYDCAQYKITIEEGEYSKEYQLCKSCDYKISNILCVGSRRAFAEHQKSLNPNL